MQCPRCKSEISEDAHYCQNCGRKIERCPSCHQPIIDGAKFCSHCGTSLNNMGENTYTQYQQQSFEQSPLDSFYQPINEDDTMKEEKPKGSFKDIKVSKKVNWTVLIMSVLVLVLLTGVSIYYLQKTKNQSIYKENQTVENQDIMKVNGTTPEVSLIGNRNQGGHVVLYKDHLYLCDDNNYLVSMDSDLKNQKVLMNSEVEYLFVQDDIIYYTNDKNQLCSMDINGENQKIIIDKAVYYVTFENTKIYYQLDSDQERIYVYDMNSKKTKCLNERRSYNINIVDDKIYYTSTDGIYCMGVDGQGEEKIISGQCYSLIYDQKKLYYTTSDSQIMVYDLQTNKTSALVEESAQLFNMTSQYIYYQSSKGLKRYDRTTKETKVIYNGSVRYCEIAGDQLIVTTYSYSDEGYRVIMNSDGTNQQRLFTSNDGNFV